MLFASVALLLSGCQKSAAPNVAATVNGRPITYADLDRAIAAQFPNSQPKTNPDQTTQLRLEALRALIDNEILLQRAEKEGLLASDSDVEAKYNEVKVGYTEEQFQKQMDQRKMSVADLKTQIRRELSVEKLMNKEIGSHITISDADVNAFYAANKPSFNLPESKVHLAQILVTSTPDPNVSNLKNNKAQNDAEARNKIQMIDMRIHQGEDFATLAQNYSEDPSGANGGDVGFVPESTLDKGNQELQEDDSRHDTGTGFTGDTHGGRLPGDQVSSARDGRPAATKRSASTGRNPAGNFSSQAANVTSGVL